MILFLSAVAGASIGAAPVGAFVLNHTVEAGAILDRVDFALRPDMLPANGLSPRQAEGREAVRRLAEGGVVRPTDVRLPQQVKRGDSIVITLQSGALLITTQGRALSGGAIGDPVRVTSDTTRRTLQAVVEGPRRVKILSEWE